jgi:hypothetical protein
MKVRLGRRKFKMVEHKKDAREKLKTKSSDIPWGKSLEMLSPFTKKEIYLHRQKSGKLKPEDVSNPIKKTLK